jgi:hypothetical protein
MEISSLGGYTTSFGPGTTDGWLLKTKPNGDTIWTKNYGGAGDDYFYTIQPTSDGNFWAVGSTNSFGMGRDDGWIIRLIADQYAYKDSLFIYKIPTYGEDTLDFGYTPLKVPSGMRVSLGGTISWTPQSDSSYIEHVEYLVLNDTGRKDTLTFNILVNYYPSASVKFSRINKTQINSFKITATSSSNRIKFVLPSLTTSFCIYDVNGRIVDKINPVITGSEAYAFWPGASSSCTKIPQGKYFAKISLGENTTVKPFLIVH